MSVILHWHLANWNGFSVVDVFLNRETASHPSTSLHPAFALQTQGDGENNCHSAVKCFIEIQNCVCVLHIHTLFTLICDSALRILCSSAALVCGFKVRTPVVDGEQLIYYHTVALSLAGTVVSALPVGHLRLSEAALENLQIFQHDKAKKLLLSRASSRSHSLWLAELAARCSL